MDSEQSQQHPRVKVLLPAKLTISGAGNGLRALQTACLEISEREAVFKLQEPVKLGLEARAEISLNSSDSIKFKSRIVKCAYDSLTSFYRVTLTLSDSDTEMRNKIIRFVQEQILRGRPVVS